MSIDFFNKHANSWEDQEKSDLGKRFAEAIYKQLPIEQSWNVVEFGAGTGVVGRRFSERVRTVTLVDPSVEMLKVAQDLCLKEARNNVNTYHSSLQEYSENYSSVADLAIMVMALHHIVDLTSAIQQLEKVVKRDGYIAIIDLYENDGSFHQHLKNFEGHDGFSLKDLTKSFTQLGFEIIYADPIYHGEKNTDHGTAHYSQFLFIAKKSLA